MLEERIKELTEAVVALTAAMAGGAVAAPAKKKAAKKPPEPAATAPVAEAPQAAPATTPAPAMTIDEVRVKLGAAIQANGPGPVEEALKTLGVAKLSDLPAEKYGDLLAAVGV